MLNPSQALPGNELTLIYFAVYLAKTLEVATITTYLAGVRNLHILNGFDLPLKQFVRLQYVLRGIKRVHFGAIGPWSPPTHQIQSHVGTTCDFQFWKKQHSV